MNDDDNRLRNVALGDSGYTLTTWDTGRRFDTGQCRIRYRFSAPDGKVIFEGDDYGCSPFDCVDSDNALRGILGFLTIKPGDTDPEYFENYTPDQLAFCDSDAESLQVWGMEPQEDEDEPPQFIDLDCD